MSCQSFQLRPFSPPPAGEQQVPGTISRDNNEFHLLLTLTGQSDTLLIPEPVLKPDRADGLWQTTCFEWFFRVAGSSSYYEVNISSSGCWNLYHFQAYREGMRQAPVVVEPTIVTVMDDAVLTIDCVLPLAGLVQPTDVLDIGVSCVLAYRDGGKNYWALCHPGAQPDFHHPQGFLLRL